MAVRIRLRRLGKKKSPFFRFVATDSRTPRDGRFIEMLGWYNPIEKPATVKIDVEKTLEWLKRGAEPSDTVRSLYQQIGLWNIWEQVQKGEEPSDLTVTERITERSKRRKGQKAVAKAEAAEKAEKEEAAPAEEKAVEEAEEKTEEPAEEPKEEAEEEKKEE